MSDTSLKNKLRELSEEMRNMRFQGAVNPLENPLLVRTTRRTIARIETILRERLSAGAK